MAKARVEKTRLNLYVSVKLREQLEDYCDEMGVNISAGTSMILKTFFDQQAVVTMAKRLEEMEQEN